MLDALARRLLQAERPVIIAGDEIVKSDALEAAAALCRDAGLRLCIQQSAPYGAHFLSEHACYMGSLSRDQKQVRGYARAARPAGRARLPIRCACRCGARSSRCPTACAVVHIGLVDWDMGKNFAAELAVRADVRETLLALTPLLQKQGGERLAEKAAKASLAQLAHSNWTAKRAGSSQNASQARAGAKPIDADWLSLQIAEALPATRCSSTRASPRRATSPTWCPIATATAITAWHPAASAGRCRQRSAWRWRRRRARSCCFSGDGSAMYSIQALWTAANAKLPITYVIANNGGYRIIKQRLKAFHGSERYVGMDFDDPKIDFAALARSLGMPAERISEPDALAPARCSGPSPRRARSCSTSSSTGSV